MKRQPIDPDKHLEKDNTHKEIAVKAQTLMAKKVGKVEGASPEAKRTDAKDEFNNSDVGQAIKKS